MTWSFTCSPLLDLSFTVIPESSRNWLNKLKPIQTEIDPIRVVSLMVPFDWANFSNGWIICDRNEHRCNGYCVAIKFNSLRTGRSQCLGKIYGKIIYQWTMFIIFPWQNVRFPEGETLENPRLFRRPLHKARREEVFFCRIIDENGGFTWLFFLWDIPYLYNHKWRL